MRKLSLLGLALLMSSACSTGGAHREGQGEIEAKLSAKSPQDRDALPPGWKVPQRVRRSTCKRGADGLFEASADYDGNGENDTARLLIREKGVGLGVWIWLAGQPAPVLASISEVRDGKHDMGIRTVEPGSYVTACGKGHWPCGDKEPAELTLEREAIDFFNCEGANRFLSWDPLHSRFMTTWMSD